MAVRLRDYRDFRAFLKAYYLHEKRKDPAFSYGAFAKRARLSPRGHLKLVIDHGRRLSGKTLGQYVKALRLGEKDEAYFRLLVARDQATRPREREVSRIALERWTAEHQYRNAPPETFGRFPNPFLLGVLYAMAALKGFRPDAGWLSRRLLHEVPAEEIRRALDFLLEEGHLKKTGGRVKKGLGLRFDEQAVAPIYREARRWVLDGKLHAAPYPAVFTAVPLSRERLAELHESQIRWLQENVLGKPAGEEGERLALVHWEILPLTKG